MPSTHHRSDDATFLIRYEIMGSVRKQYFFRPRGDAYDAWDIERLIEQAAELPVKKVSLTEISEIDSVYWFGADGSPPRCGSWCGTCNSWRP